MKDRRKQFKFELADYIKNLQQLCLALDSLWKLIKIRHEQEQTDPYPMLLVNAIDERNGKYSI